MLFYIIGSSLQHLTYKKNKKETSIIMSQAASIDEVISILDQIILESEENQNPKGYFAALYRKVTIKVKEGIESDYFDDGPRMEKLDVIFANRYIAAYYDYQEKKHVTRSWEMAFVLSTKYWPIVLQRLLIGMNAHINLDLGIAAAEISMDGNIEDLEGDFNKINDILSELVVGVEQDLAKIWPTLKILLKLTGKIDDFLIDFSMKLARGGAWKFAKSIVDKSSEELDALIKIRDQKVAKKANIITNPGIIIKAIFAMVRFGERGSVSDRIKELKD